jgi:hypothetical protein
MSKFWRASGEHGDGVNSASLTGIF